MSVNLNDIASGSGNVVGHTVTAAVLGDGLSSVVVWGVQTFGHVDIPAAVSQNFTAVCMVFASWIMSKVVSN